MMGFGLEGNCKRKWNLAVVLWLFLCDVVICEAYDETLTATTAVSYLTSPGYPTAYTNNLTYDWLIESENVGEVVKISVLDCEIEYVNAKVPSCQLDFLRIYDGAFDNATVLYDSCCMTSVPDMNSTTQYLLIRFITDSTITAKGFRIEYYNSGSAGADSQGSIASAGSIYIVVIVIGLLVVIGIFVAIYLIFKIKSKEKSTHRINPVGGEENHIEQDEDHQPIHTPIDEYTKKPISFPPGSPIPPPEVWTEAGGSGNAEFPPKKKNLFDLKLPQDNTRGNKLPPVDLS